MATTIRIPIDLRNPAASTNPGNTFWTVTGLTAWDAGHWEFVKSTAGKIYGVVTIPKNVAATPNASIILSIAANVAAGTTVIDVNTTTVATTANFNPASLTLLFSQTTPVPGTARQRKDLSTSTQTVTADDILIVEIAQSSAANQNANLELYEAWLQIDVS